MRGPAPVTVTVSDDERQRLDSWAHRSRSAPQVARRARIILACAAGRSTTSIAKRFHVSRTTVCKWRTRFVRDRLEGLIDEPRPGTPRRITDAQVEQVVIATLETTPRGATQWSTRDMAKATGLSHMTIQRIWQAFGLQPHRSSVRISRTPLTCRLPVKGYGTYRVAPAVSGGTTRRTRYALNRPSTSYTHRRLHRCHPKPWRFRARIK